MAKGVFCILLGGFAFFGQVNAQQVFVHSDEAAPATATNPKKQPATHAQASPSVVTRQNVPKAQPVIMKAQPVQEQVASTTLSKPQVVKPQPQVAQTQPAVAHTIKAPAPDAQSSPSMATKFIKAPAVAQNSKPTTPGVMPLARNMHLTKVEGPAAEPSVQLPLAQNSGRILHLPTETAFIKVADGFDFPVGKPDAQGYYKARGFRSHGHLGEDWDGIRGGDTDLGDPIYSIGDGIVVFARDCHQGWGNVVIVRHSYREAGTVKNVDAFYGHLNSMLVRRGQTVSRGQKIATMGNAHGLYDAHLHLEIRKNIEIGMSRSAFAQDSSNYYDPTQFIASHRHLQNGGGTYKVAMNTFVRDARINFGALHNYSHSRYRGGTGESATALKKAVATAKH